MVKHIILWTLKDGLSEEEKATIKASIKEGLESLLGVVPGLVDIKVQIDGRLASSNADLMLDCTLESEELCCSSCARCSSKQQSASLHRRKIMPRFQTIAQDYELYRR